MEDQKLYRKFSEYYDLIYSDKDYKGEVRKIREIISEYKESNGERLLDVGCGSGGHLQYLKNHFSCTGMDVNEDILERARNKVEDVDFVQGDMIDFSLDEKFDIITCLFSSIGYVKTVSNLERTLRNFYDHLNTDGIVVIEPWFDSSGFKEGNIDIKKYEGEDVKVVRGSISRREGNQSVIEMHYLIAEEGVGISHHVDKHRMGIFEVSETIEIMENIGFETEHIEEGFREDDSRGLIIGVKN